MLVADPLPAPAPGSLTNQNAGTVDFASYAPRRIVLQAKADAPAVLLLNDRFSPIWKVSVDGKPAKLLRCNYLMRGVYLPPGSHTVAFRFSPPTGRVLCQPGRSSGRRVAALLFGLWQGERIGAGFNRRAGSF